MHKLSEREEKARKQKNMAAVEVGNVLKILQENYINAFVANSKKIKYPDIVKQYQLKNRSHIIWIKFAKAKNCKEDDKSRFVGVVGAGADINRFWNNKNKSGHLVIDIAKLEWDKENIIIIPLPELTEECKGHYTKDRNKIEREIGDLLISHKIPVIDYFSHLN